MIARDIFSRDTPIICTVKQNTYTKYNPLFTKIKDLAANHFIKKVSHFISVSEKTISLYKERFNVNLEKFTCITQLGVDTDLFKPVNQEQKIVFRKIHKLTEDSFIVGYVGRFNRIKGIENLLKAMKLARKSSDLNLNLVLLGSGDLEDFLFEESQKYSWLHILHRVSHSKVSSLLKALDIFILPTQISECYEEHDGHALLEAMATGLPCIGTNSGVIPEILEGIGIVVKAGNDNLLCSKILELSQNVKLRRKLGTFGRERILSKYSIESVGFQRCQVYRKVLGRE